MKITFFIGSLYGGGAERVTCNLASFLVQHGHEVEILTMSETEQTYELDKRVTSKVLLPLIDRKGKMWNTVIRLLRFFRYMRQHETDIYIVMLPKTTIMLLLFKWLSEAKVIAAERVDPAAYSSLIAKVLKKYASRADGWVFQTKDAKKWYGEAIKNCKTIVIPNAINLLFIRAPYKGTRRKVIAGVGRLSKQKNFSLLIRAFAKISPDFPDYSLTIYGKGDMESELKDLAVTLGVQEKVQFPGNIQNIADEMEKNTMFVLSSDFEGMPNALMEAMALGVPCIATDCPCGGPRYLIQNDVNGLLVPVGDVDEMAEAMSKVLGDPKKAKNLGEEARKITERLEPNKVYGEWEKFIYAVVGEGKINVKSRNCFRRFFNRWSAKSS